MKTMKMNKGALIVALLLVSHVCHAAVTPAASRFDPRNQIVSYNPQNTTVINSAVGYTTNWYLTRMKRSSVPEPAFPRAGK